MPRIQLAGDCLTVYLVHDVASGEDAAHTRLQAAVDMDLAAGVGLEQIQGIV